MRGDVLTLHQGRFRFDIKGNFFSQGAARHWHSWLGRGGWVTVPGDVPDPWGYGIEGCGHGVRVGEVVLKGLRGLL